MPASLVDFHCHLDLYPNFPELVAECERRRIYTLAVTTTPRAWQRNKFLADSKEYVYAALGLHPQLVNQCHQEADLFCELISQAYFIGEIGLDGSRHYASSIGLQKIVLEKILIACESNGGRIMSLHSRGATGEVLNMLEKYKNAGTPVLHWFSGTEKELQRAILLGCWFSVGSTMLSSVKGAEIVRKIPTDRILTETDGPFTRENKKVLMPWNAESAIDKLSKIWNEDANYVRQQILENFRCLSNVD